MKQTELNNQILDVVESLLDDNHTLSFRMQGFSMYPTLQAGDLGHVEKCSADDLSIGDLIVFRANDKLVAHRLVDIFHQNNQRVFVAKGDHNSYKDAPFTDNELVGRITSIQRKNRTIKSQSLYMKFHLFNSKNFSKILIPVNDFLIRFRSQIGRLSSGFKSMKDNVAIVSQNSEKLFLVNAIFSVFQGVIPFVVIVCIKSLIDQLTVTTAYNAHEHLMFVTMLIVTALVFLLSAVLSEISSFYMEKMAQSVTHTIYQKLHAKHIDLELSNYENPAKQDKIHRAVQEASYRPLKIMSELLMGIKSVASALFLVGIFMSIRWYLVLVLFVAVVPGIFVRLKFSKELYKLKELQSTKEREMYYYNRILTGFPFAKELKLFGFSHFFRNLFSDTQHTLFEQKINHRKAELKMGLYAQFFAVSMIFLSLGFVTYMKINDEISIGTVVLFFFAFQRGYSVLTDFFRSITQIIEDNTFLKDFIQFLNTPTRVKIAPLKNHRFSLQKEIRFENVSFKYESSKREAIKSVNLTIPVGKTIAFVGANGSGKSTMIKLLCGFYPPDSGKILFDDVDAASLGQTVVCDNITAVFQDFALYNISAIENIWLGSTKSPFRRDQAQKAAQAAGIADIIEGLPDGYNTLLGNQFKGGEELSIGQWQKIAIARAFYRDSPLILMDEPSSALDAEAELQIIEGLKKLSEDKTAVIISHRLSTVQWADLIYFFQEGQVLESGTHKQLMAKKGKYYSLFKTANGQKD